MSHNIRTRSKTNSESSTASEKDPGENRAQNKIKGKPDYKNFIPDYNSTKQGNPLILRSPPARKNSIFTFEINREEPLAPKDLLYGPYDNELFEDTIIAIEQKEGTKEKEASDNLLQFKQVDEGKKSTNTGARPKIKQPQLQTSKMANNTTLRDALADNKTPATPKFIQPPVFNPSLDLPVTFISKYERTAICNSWSDSYKISYLGNFLEGPACHWYNTYSTSDANKNKTWEQIKHDFIKEFSGEQPLRKLKFKLSSRKQQTNEDIKTYYFDLLALAHEVDPNMSIDNFREYFENGLHSSYYETYFLMCTTGMTHASLKTQGVKTGRDNSISQIVLLTIPSLFISHFLLPRLSQMGY